MPFVLLLLIALTAIWLTLPAMQDFNYSNGKELLAWYIPLPASILFFALSYYYRRPLKKSALLTLLLFVLLWVPFIPHLADAYKYYEQDDGTRYRIVATKMVKEKTLNAGDDAIFGTGNKVYMIQPGYRYYLAFWIKIFGNENRLYQVFNMLVYLSSVLLLLIRTRNVAMRDSFRIGMLGFVLLSAPFVVKLIMMGLTEWLAISIFLFAISGYLSRYLLVTLILLALVPFIRQNLVFVSVLLMLWMVRKEKQKVFLIVIYFAILMLPLYHNLYYAGKWQFFSVYNDPSTFMVWDFEGSFISRLLKNVLYHLSLYSGFNYKLENSFAHALSLACIPLGTYLVFWGFYLLGKKNRWWYLLMVSSAIVPTLVFGGTAYFPRFEWVNLFVGLGAFIVLQHGLVDRKVTTVDCERKEL